MHPHFIQGHRGARARFPENSIIGFRQSFEQGVRAFELDVVISRDRKVVVSHEPWIHPKYCVIPDHINSYLEETNLYKLNYEAISSFDCGSKIHPDFPEQFKTKTSKPLLIDVIQAFSQEERSKILWNIELKSEEPWYGKFQPRPAAYARIFLQELQQIVTEDKFIVQSFDPNLLNELYSLKPNLTYGLLVENNKSVSENLATLNFKPTYYNLDQELMTPAILDSLKGLNIKSLSWTVNSIDRAQELITLGIDGIITDDPVMMLEKL